ncbi:hypothetical protein ACW7GZ_14885 [Luteimonas sp. A537]
MKLLAVIAFFMVFLGGCGLIEPSATDRFSTKPGTSSEAIFACAETTIRTLKIQRGTWSDLITARDASSGLFETNRFNESNIVGIRTQIRYEPETGDGRIKVKASGPYFADLGADQAAAQFASGIAACLRPNNSFKPTPLRGAA